MAKLTKVQRRTLERVLHDLRRAVCYIDRPDTAVCAVKSQATTTLDFTRASDTRVLYEVRKEYGSDLCGATTALGELERFIGENIV